MFVILGATGKTGGCAATALMEQGKPVRVVVRDAGKGAAWKARGADVAVADVDDAPALARTLRGAEGAYIIVPRNFGVADVLDSRKRCIDSLARAIVESGIEHVVFMSSVGAHRPARTGLIGSLYYAEQRLADIKADITFVRGSYFLENWEPDVAAMRNGNVFNTFLRADHRIPQVAVRDLGDMIAGFLLNRRRGHRVVECTGPADWSPAEIAETIGEVTGKPIEIKQWPASVAADALVQFGLPRPVAVLIQEMYEALDSEHVALEFPQTARRGAVSAKTAIAGMWSGATASL
jgi:NAD(P)H dehydrogenase (quinone)